MIKLVYCIRKRADISVDEFNRYWWEEHGPKVKSVRKVTGALKYVQSYLCAPELNQQIQASRSLADPYDGITEVWWENEQTMAAQTESPEGVEAMRMLIKDEAKFIDFEHSRVFVTVEREVFDFTREQAQ